MAILVAAVLPLVSADMQRRKEEELVFRGLQYAEGVRVFRRKFGRYPASLKEMLEIRPRVLRQLWKDPMTGQVDWVVVGPTLAVGVQRTPVPGANAPAPTPTPTPGPFGSGGPADGGGPGSALVPVFGVHSRVAKKGFRLFEGRENYSDWIFTEQTIGASTGPSGAVTPGGLPGPGILPPGGGSGGPSPRIGGN